MDQAPQTRPSDGSEWPPIAEEERTLYEIMFYSQGPVDGYLLGEGVRDVFLKSGLSLRVLSQIWNLADVSNDNVLNVHEFVLIMHLIRGLLKGLPAPPTLPRKLTPPKSLPVPLDAPTEREREAYCKVFQALDLAHSGFLDADSCRQVFIASGLTSEQLTQVWNLSDVTRDGRLDLEEFCLACHLLRFLKSGHSISGPVDVFKLLPDRIASKSLQARKQRVQKYEEHKQKLMSLKEKRKQQVLQESHRQQLQQDKLDLLRQVFKVQKKSQTAQVTEEEFAQQVARQKEELEQLEEIVIRLKKEHEKVRQETVKTILAEQKLNNDIISIKKETDELNKRLGTSHTHATKDPDPFHQFYEHRKEKRQGSTLNDLDKIEVSLPFTFNPFDPSLDPLTLSPGAQLLCTNNNHVNKGHNCHGVLTSLAGFGEGFDALMASSTTSAPPDNQADDDPVFKEVPWSMERERWLGYRWGPEDGGVLGLSGPETAELQEKLLTLHSELRKLNQPGTRLVFKNPDDYLSRKRAKEEEEKGDRSTRFNRRSLTERLSSVSDTSPRLRERARDRQSYTERNDEASQAVREYRQKRLSQQGLDPQFTSSVCTTTSSAPRPPERPSRTRSTPSLYGSTASETASKEGGALTSAQPSTSFIRQETEAARSTVLPRAIPEASTPPSSPPSVEFSRTPLNINGSSSQSDSSKHRAEAEDELGIDSARPSSKKTRAPPPPPTASTGEPAQSRPVRNLLVTDRPTQPNSLTVSATRPGANNLEIDEVKVLSADQTLTVTANRSPDRPERPKRRKDLQNASSSGAPTSPRGTHSQQTILIDDLRTQTKVSDVIDSAPQEFLLKENPLLEAEVPKPEGTVTTSKKSHSSPPFKRGNSPQLTGKSPAVRQQQHVDVVKANAVDPTLNLGIKEVLKGSAGTHKPSDPPSTTTSHKPQQQGVKSGTAAESKSPEAGSFRASGPGAGPLSNPQNLIPDLSPDSFSRDLFTDRDSLQGRDPDRDSFQGRDPDRDSLKSRGSDTSSLCDSDADSLPPPLPCSAPPPLPSNLPPGKASSHAEVIEIRRLGPKLQSAPTPPARIQYKRTRTGRMSEGVGVVLVMEAPVTEDRLLDTTSPDSLFHEKQSSEMDLGSELLGLGSDRLAKNKEVAKVSNGTVHAKSDPTKEESDSDLSSDENVREGNFSLSDSGVVVSSLPTSPDDIDNNNDIDSQIELISYSRNTGGLASAVIPKSAAKEHDLTVDGDLEVEVEGITEFRASSTTSSSSPNHRPQSLSVAECQPSSQAESLPLLSSQAESLPLSQDDEQAAHAAVTLSSSDIAAMTPRSREIFEKARHFAEMVQKPSFTVKREKLASSELVEGDFSQEKLQDLELQRRAAISQSTVRRKELSSPVSPTPGVALTTHSVSVEAKLSTPPSPSASPPESLMVPASPIPTSSDLLILPASTAPKTDDLTCAAPVLVPVVGGFGDGIQEVCEPATVHQTVENHFEVPSPERSASPQARWTDNAGRYMLYSENVVREDNSSEVVDRESIANLATTRQQWETIFSMDPKQEQPKMKKNPPKWQVRMPYTEKAAPSQATVTSNNSSGRSSPSPDKPLALEASDMESNIEREIRLAMEREEMLKREHEGRLQGGSQHKQYKVSSMESSTESELLQPTFHELTEADRGSEFLINEQRMQQANSMQEESLQKAFHHQKLHPPHRNDDDGVTESIIDLEIRLQREREAELARQREEVSTPKKVEVLSPALPQVAHAPPPPPLQVRAEVVEDISYEEAVSQSSHQGESRIAQELRELKEREAEMRQLRERMNKASLGAGDSHAHSKTQVAVSTVVSESTPKPAVHSSHTTDKEAVSQSVSRSVHASHSLDPSPSSNDASVTQLRQETPMQREIRLARERENEFRRSKGLPELPTTESDGQTNGTLPKTVDAVDGGSHGGGNFRHSAPQPDSSIRHFASNRLQREILEQKQREQKLQQEGHIITTSEEHIQPMRYAEVVGQETADSPVKRNFKAPVRRDSSTPEEAAAETKPSPVHKQGSQPPARDSPVVKKTPGSSASFKYKEFAQTAESKIERELREMREREEELRKQREGGSVDS